MREIKFEYVFKNQETGNIIRERYDIISIEGIARDDIHYYAERGYKLVARRQPTGTHDKNGVEIYESDVIRWFSNKHYWEAVISTINNAKTNTLYAVETFNNVSVDKDRACYTYERNDSRKGARKVIESLNRSVEVIGNIHENPELLND